MSVSGAMGNDYEDLTTYEFFGGGLGVHLGRLGGNNLDVGILFGFLFGRHFRVSVRSDELKV